MKYSYIWNIFFVFYHYRICWEVLHLILGLKLPNAEKPYEELFQFFMYRVLANICVTQADILASSKVEGCHLAKVTWLHRQLHTF